MPLPICAPAGCFASHAATHAVIGSVPPEDASLTPESGKAPEDEDAGLPELEPGPVEPLLDPDGMLGGLGGVSTEQATTRTPPKKGPRIDAAVMAERGAMGRCLTAKRATSIPRVVARNTPQSGVCGGDRAATSPRGDARRTTEQPGCPGRSADRSRAILPRSWQSLIWPRGPDYANPGMR